jgi:TusA-related sulfurtransferase
LAYEPNDVLDVRNEICSFREIRTLKKVKQMKPGEILAILVDYAPALERVPNFLKKKGHIILGIDETGKNEWKILVKIQGK